MINHSIPCDLIDPGFERGFFFIKIFDGIDGLHEYVAGQILRRFAVMGFVIDEPVDGFGVVVVDFGKGIELAFLACFNELCVVHEGGV